MTAGFSTVSRRSHLLREREDERREERDNFLHVREVGHIDDAVHVAEGIKKRALGMPTRESKMTSVSVPL